MMILYAALVWCVTLGGAFLYGVNVGDDRETAAVARENRVAQVAREAAQKGAAEAIAANKPKNVTIRQEVEREIQTNVEYRDCRHSDQQLRRINAAITGGYDPEPAGSGIVPRVDALGGPILRGNDQKTDRDRGTVSGLSNSGTR